MLKYIIHATDGRETVVLGTSNGGAFPNREVAYRRIEQLRKLGDPDWRFHLRPIIPTNKGGLKA